MVEGASPQSLPEAGVSARTQDISRKNRTLNMAHEVNITLMFCILGGKECFTQIPRKSEGSGTFCGAHRGVFQQLSAGKSEAGSHCPPVLGQKLKARNQSGEHSDTPFHLHRGLSDCCPLELDISLEETAPDILQSQTIPPKHVMNPSPSLWFHFDYPNHCDYHLPPGLWLAYTPCNAFPPQKSE